ncbi:hypothetical protein BP951000_1970 [Brachyspira pilosicoli 95/1000]|uniref:Uncharacterized protein n=1 Tax=Brachyspira pilosicoli (strain ATCC BAA-1826 / 95/1000) TaxID=759914 RepID=D8IFM5_BRAP9|nr:hypothetical protein BP951000_1970 [Brachyspira pilosicoli 95/1000]
MIIIVVAPTDKPDIVLATYGTLEIGEVPSAALIEKAIPKDII